MIHNLKYRGHEEIGAVLGEWQADLILSNNDFTGGVPPAFQTVADFIIPPPRLGWHRRNKSDHFKILGTLIGEFAGDFAELGIETEVGGTSSG